MALRQLQGGVLRVVAAVVLGGLLLGGAGLVRAEEDTVSTQELRQAIDSEMASPAYEWRMPREPVPDDYDPGLLASLGESILDGLRWLGRQLKDIAEAIFDWLKKLLPDADPDEIPEPGFFQNADPLWLALYLLGSIVV